jgi:hypothetical protein
MIKTVNLQLSEKEFNQVMLCYMLDDFVKGLLEMDVSEKDASFQNDLGMKLFKGAYEAGLKASGKFEDISH